MGRIILQVGQDIDASTLVDGFIQMLDQPRSIISKIQTRYTGQFQIELQTSMERARHIRVVPVVQRSRPTEISGDLHLHATSEQADVRLTTQLDHLVDEQRDSYVTRTLHTHPPSQASLSLDHGDVEYQHCMDERSWVMMDLVTACLKAMDIDQVIVYPMKGDTVVGFDQLTKSQALGQLIINAICTKHALYSSFEMHEVVKKEVRGEQMVMFWCK